MKRQILGLVMLLIAIIGLTISVGGIVVSGKFLDEIESSLDSSLQLATDSLGIVGDSLHLANEAAGQVNITLETVSETAISVTQAIDDTQPLIEQVTQVITEEVPDSLATVADTVPNVAVAAGAIHDTLLVLDSFQANRRILGVPVSFDLGVDYNPSIPLDETVVQLGASFDDIPDSLRSLDVNLLLANESLLLIGQNVESIAEDLLFTESSISQIEPLLDDSLELVTETNDLIWQTRGNLPGHIDTARLVITVIFVVIGLNQIVPLYLGGRLLSSQKREE